MKIFAVVAVFVPLITFASAIPGGQPRGFVSDHAGLLMPSERAALESSIAQFERETSHEIAVVTIPNLGGDTIEHAASQLFADWGIGKRGNDNGVLVLVARDDRKIRIEVGYGLEGALTDAQSFWIIEQVMRPAFQSGNYFAGIRGAVEKIMAATRGEAIPSRAPHAKNSLSFFEILWVAFFPFLWGAAILARSKSWWAGGVLGAIIAGATTLYSGFFYGGLAAFLVLIPFGLWFDFVVSRAYARGKSTGVFPWWIGGGRGNGGFGGGGFGGFGGGRSGGGGASGGW